MVLSDAHVQSQVPWSGVYARQLTGTSLAQSTFNGRICFQIATVLDKKIYVENK